MNLLQFTGLNICFMQKIFAIIFSICEQSSKISDCVFTRVFLEADNVISFKQNSKNRPHLKIHVSATLQEQSS